MKNKVIKVFVGLVIFLGIIVFLGNSYFGFIKKPEPSVGNNDTNIQLTPVLKEVLSQVEKSNTSQVPVDWKIYKPKNLQVTFKYPPNLLFQDTQSGVNIYYDIPPNRAYIKNPSEYERNIPGMFINGVSNVSDLDVYLEKNYSEFMSLWEHSTTTLFGQKAVVSTGQGMDRWDLILFIHNNTLYEITFAGGEPGDEMRSNYYKILSSFDFAD
jgi:hypothetical protein